MSEADLNLWQYRARITNVVDGDTFDVVFDPGFELTYEERVRLAGVDTREIHFVSHDSEEYKRGIIHKEFVEEWVREHQNGEEWPFVAETDRDRRGKYGRYIADVKPRQESNEWLSDALLDSFDDVEVY